VGGVGGVYKGCVAPRSSFSGGGGGGGGISSDAYNKRKSFRVYVYGIHRVVFIMRWHCLLCKLRTKFLYML